MNWFISIKEFNKIYPGIFVLIVLLTGVNGSKNIEEEEYGVRFATDCEGIYIYNFLFGSYQCSNFKNF